MSRRLGDDPLARAREARAAQASGGVPLESFTGARTSYNDILFQRRWEGIEVAEAVAPQEEAREISEVSEIPEIHEAAGFQEVAITEAPAAAPEAQQAPQEAQTEAAVPVPLVSDLGPSATESAEAPAQQEPAAEAPSSSLLALPAATSPEEPVAQEQSGQGA